jgi:hypothetical protein
MGDPALISGMGDLISPEFTGGSLNLDELEKQFLGARARTTNPEEKLRADLTATARELGLDFADLTPREGTPIGTRTNTPRETFSRIPTPRPESTPRDDTPRDDNFGFQYSSPRPFAAVTEEQEHRQHINSVMSDMRAPVVSFDAAKEHDDKLLLLAEIDELKNQLSAIGADISNVGAVGPQNSMDDIKTVRNVLRLKDDRHKYSQLANELIMLGAHAVEELFNGERVWLGRYRPDMRGWHNHVQVKLRRMQYDLSNFTGSIVQDYKIGSSTRLFMELIPSAILYSKQKSTNMSTERPAGSGMSRFDE